jgi:hypothetical protein
MAIELGFVRWNSYPTDPSQAVKMRNEPTGRLGKKEMKHSFIGSI